MPVAVQSYNSSVKQLVLDLIPEPLPTLANFVVGENAEAFNQLSAAASGSFGVDGGNVVYLWGAAGCGKTHLARALSAATSAPILAVIGVAESLLPLAVVDDVETLDDDSLQGLFNLINQQRSSGGGVVATGRVAPRDLPIRRDLASRLGSGLVFQLKCLSDEEKANALRAHARTRGFRLREDVVSYLLRHSRREMTSLVSMLDALDRYSIESGREITLPLLREIMQPSLV
jgi:DnaA family protein